VKPRNSSFGTRNSFLSLLAHTEIAGSCAAGRSSNFDFRVSIFALSALLALSACGAPGDPQPPRPVVPEAVSDLAARQVGDSVVLTFTLPAKSLEGDTLAEPPDVEILRGVPRAGEAEPPLVYTVPGALVDTYLTEGRFRFVDPLKPEDRPRDGSPLVYLVRTRASKRRASADSNRVSVRLLPVPESVRQLRARVTESAIELDWLPPERTTTGAPIASLAGYRIYRAELEPGASAPTELAQAKLKSPLELLGPTPAPSFRDTRFEFDHTYAYIVRSVAQQDLESVESADSELAVVTPHDTFAPAAPENLVAVLVPATPESPAAIELSWAISPESDVAGYNIYRSEQEDTPGIRLNRELLPVPTFRDTDVVAAKRYFYLVTAVDRAGNESSRSLPVAVEVPGPAK
jgi:hypothetical protein